MLDGTPMPGEVSDRMISVKDHILNSIFPRTRVLLAPDNFANVADRGEEALPITKVDLVRKLAKAPAPFVGDVRSENAAYFWEYFIDDFGVHWVAGEAELIFHSDFNG